jgi:hypothetical protein
VVGSPLAWQRTDPRGYTVQCKATTWQYKILAVPVARRGVWMQQDVELTAERPDLILDDPTHAGRERYVRLYWSPVAQHLMLLVLPVDVLPGNVRDVVTVIPKDGLKQEKGSPQYARP